MFNSKDRHRTSAAEAAFASGADYLAASLIAKGPGDRATFLLLAHCQLLHATVLYQGLSQGSLNAHAAQAARIESLGAEVRNELRVLVSDGFQSPAGAQFPRTSTLQELVLDIPNELEVRSLRVNRELMWRNWFANTYTAEAINDMIDADPMLRAFDFVPKT